MDPGNERQTAIGQSRFYTSIVGAALITLGIVLAENVLEKGKGSSSSAGGTAALLLFIIGWIVFFSTQGHDLLWLKGIGVPIVAIIGQVYFMFVLKQAAPRRRQLIWATIVIWMAFAALWFFYAYQMTLEPGTDRVNTHRAANVWTGLALLMVGMMGYFFVRGADWNQLTGGLIPRMPMGMGMFNIFVPMIGFGWVLIALGNSVIDSE